MRIAHSLFYHVIGKRRQELPFIIFLSFLLAFCTARAIVYMSMMSVLPRNFFLNIRGVHIHHLSYGIFILAALGYVMLVCTEFTKRHGRVLALLYGIGLGLTFDEFGMWIRLQDEYWIRQSYDAVIVIAAIFMNIIYFKPFWKRLGGAISRKVRRFVNMPRRHTDNPAVTNRISDTGGGSSP